MADEREEGGVSVREPNETERLFRRFAKIKIDSHGMLLDVPNAQDFFFLFTRLSSLRLDYGDIRNATTFRVLCFLY